MSRVRELRGTDPMETVEVEQLAKDPAFADLFSSIVATPFGPLRPDAGPASAPIAFENRSHQLRTRRYRLLVAVAAVVVLLAVVVSLVVTNSARPTKPERHAVAVPTWHLTASIVQPAWQVLSPGNGSDPYTITCSSSSNCYATGLASAKNPGGAEIVEVSHDAGSTWKPSLLPSGSGQVFGVTCPTADTCMAVGDDPANPTTPSGLAAVLYTTTNAGASWSPHPIPGSFLGLEHLSCWTTSFCVALANQVGPGGVGEQDVVVVTDDGGQTWTESPLPGTFRGYSIQCVSTSVCIATGMAPAAYEVTNPLTQMENDAAIVYTTDGGTTWHSASVPGSGAIVITALTCVDTQHCMAIEDSNPGQAVHDVVITTTDGGVVWTATTGQPSASGILTLQALSCSSTVQCWVTGAQSAQGAPPASGVVFATADGGSTWQSEQLPTSSGGLQSVESITCSSSRCLALASQPSSNPNAATRQLVLSYETNSPSSVSGKAATTTRG